MTIRGIDDAGAPGQGDVGLTIGANAAKSITAKELEAGGAGLTGMLGDGTGKWRLALQSDAPVVAMSLLESPTGHLTNLSHAPTPPADGVHRVALFPAARDTWGRQGFVRVINRSQRSGEVAVEAYDGTGREFEPATFPIGAGEVVHFNSDDLEQGGRTSFSAGIGAGEGDWHLDVTSDLNIWVLPYIRTVDGFLTSMGELAPRTGNRLRLATFNPGSNRRQISILRLVNVGPQEAVATVRGFDDRNVSPGRMVELRIPTRAVREIEAAELESGESLHGSLGDGSGKWRLVVESSEPLAALSLLASPTGHLTNLSTSAPRWPPVLTEDHFDESTTGNFSGVAVGVADGEGFEPGQHGQRITATFLANSDHASLTQIGGWCRYKLHGIEFGPPNYCGYIRHALRHDAGIFWTATDVAAVYRPSRPYDDRSWFVIGGRPFTVEARTFARWASRRNVLMVSSLENPISSPLDGGGSEAVYCDDYDSSAEEWEVLCGEIDDYIAHSGTGIDKVVFAGAIDVFETGNSRIDTAMAAIRAHGVYSRHAIYVESPDSSTSHATAVLAGYAANLAYANPTWDAARLKRELMGLTREETLDYHTGRSNAAGTIIVEERTVRVIRPAFAPTVAD